MANQGARSQRRSAQLRTDDACLIRSYDPELSHCFYDVFSVAILLPRKEEVLIKKLIVSSLVAFCLAVGSPAYADFPFGGNGIYHFGNGSVYAPGGVVMISDGNGGYYISLLDANGNDVEDCYLTASGDLIGP